MEDAWWKILSPDAVAPSAMTVYAILLAGQAPRTQQHLRGVQQLVPMRHECMHECWRGRFLKCSLRAERAAHACAQASSSSPSSCS
jgi:hypothetical protein